VNAFVVGCLILGSFTCNAFISQFQLLGALNVGVFHVVLGILDELRKPIETLEHVHVFVPFFLTCNRHDAM
jgi:hypothetical protein